MHKLLRRQLQRHFGGVDAVPAELRAFVADVDSVYRESDADRALLERSMDLTSEELLGANARLRHELKQRGDAEAEIDRQRGELLQIIQSSSFGMALRRGERLVFVNPALADSLGYSVDEMVGRRAIDFFLPEDQPWVRERMARFDAGAAMRPEEVRWLRRDGTTITLEVAPVRSVGFEGSQAMLFMTHDVTERSRAEGALRASEARFDALRRSSIIGILIATAKGEFLEANDAFLDMVGYTRQDMDSGLVRWDRLTPPEWQHVNGVIGDQLRERGFAGPLEKEYFHRDGSRVPVIIGITPVDSKMQIAWVVDISDRKRLEQARRNAEELEAKNRNIQEASRLKSEFLANMSHELRTPLNAIIGYSEMLHDGELGPVSDDQRASLDWVLSSGRHLLRLINDILDLSKVEAGKLAFDSDPFSLSAVTQETIATLGAAAAESGVQIETSIDPSIDAVVGDAARFKQVLYNYVSNAIKYGGPDGRIGIRAVPEQSGLFRVEVEDTGPGIAAEDLSRLFVEFEQLDSSSTRKIGGTGLGLALTKRIVEAQGGAVGVFSTPGKGTTFHAILPRTRVQENQEQ